jgi:hypothetical protein
VKRKSVAKKKRETRKWDKDEVLHALGYAIETLEMDCEKAKRASWDEAVRRIQLLHDRLLFGRSYRPRDGGNTER